MAWSVRIAARMAQAFAFSPLAVWEGRGRCGDARSCGRTPSREVSRWMSTLLPYDVSGIVEKVIVRLPCRCTVINEPVGAVNTHWLVLCGMAMREDDELASTCPARA